MPLAINHGNNLRRQFLSRQLSTTVADIGGELTPQQKENAKKWISRFRRNLDLFATEVLGIKLYPLQRFSLHMMGISQEYMEIATRGAGKSFRIGLLAMCLFCLYPYSEIVITSSTIPQASKLVEKKIRDELIKKLSPYLLYMYEHEYIVITSNDNGYVVENKLNGSKIVVMPCLDSSRGERATVLIYEECRLLKKNIIDSVFEPMAHARQAKYLLDPKYNIPRWQEKARSYYISSSRYRHEWFSRKFRDIVTRYYTGKHEASVPFAQDIFTAIEDGSRTWADYRKAKASMNELDFKMEILNEMYGEVEDAYFNIDEMSRNQILTEPFYPPTVEDIFMRRQSNFPEKEANEIRIVGADFAFSGNNNPTKNDHTVFLCMSLHWKANHYERHVDYIETRPGGEADKVELRLKELFWFYNADYIVPDQRAGGEALYDHLTMKIQHPQLGLLWNDCGFRVIDDMDLHVITESKRDELKGRCVDPNALPCIIPFIGKPDVNSIAWQSLKKQLETNNIKFLLSGQNAQTMIEDTGEYYDLTSEQFAHRIVPFIQTDELIQEAVNLTAEYRNGFIKLSEPRTGWKDRIVVLSYCNYVAEKIENKFNRDQQEDEYDVEDIQLVW